METKHFPNFAYCI